MQKSILIPIAALILAFAVGAANPTATCPLDNQLASFTGQTRNDGKECQYSHIHFSYDINGILIEAHHVFWCDCDK